MWYNNGGNTGWLSADGSDWIKVGRSYGFAVVPQMIPAEDWMLEKSIGKPDQKGEEADPLVSETFVTELLPAYPNPFNPATDIAFSLESAGRVEISIYDVKGRLVIDLVDEKFAAGIHEIRWAGLDQSGLRVSSGTSLVHMRMGRMQETRRVMLVK